MLRGVARSSAALRRLVLASSRPSILSRAVSAGPVLHRRPYLSVHHYFHVFRPSPLALDLSRGYAGGGGKRIPDEEDSDLDDSDDEQIGKGDNFDSYEDEPYESKTWNITDDDDEDADFDEEELSGESTEESD